MVPAGAKERYILLLKHNKVRIPVEKGKDVLSDAATLKRRRVIHEDLFDFVIRYRVEYSKIFQNGLHFDIKKALAHTSDPKGFKKALKNEQGAFSQLFLAFLLACVAICNFKGAAGTLGSGISNRDRAKISVKMGRMNLD